MSETVEKSLLDTYLEEMKEDVKIDEFSAKSVQMKLPALKHKWVGRHMRTKANLHKLQRKKETLRKQLTEKLQQEAPLKVSAPVAERAVEGLPAFEAINQEIQEHGVLLEFFEKVEKVFNSMTYDIKNLIEIQKLEQL